MSRYKVSWLKAYKSTGECIIYADTIDEAHMEMDAIIDAQEGPIQYDPGNNYVEVMEKVPESLTPKDYQTAIDVQSACNLTAVLNTFHRLLPLIKQELIEEGRGCTDNINEHPTCRMFAEQIAHLSGGGHCSGANYHLAYIHCEKKAQG